MPFGSLRRVGRGGGAGGGGNVSPITNVHKSVTTATLDALPVASVGTLRLPSIETNSGRGDGMSGDSAAFLAAGLNVGVCSRQGKRPYQEDEPSVRAFLAPSTSSPSSTALSTGGPVQQPKSETHFFALFDGHAGGRCSKFLSTALADVLAEDPSFYTNLGMALKRSFHTANEQFLKVADRLRFQDGSTGICVILRNGKLTIANVGDCRAVLVSAGKAMQLSKDQKPTHPEEQKRIASLGGSVVYCMGVARVNGVLAVSRAFGNRTLRSVIRPDAEISIRDLQKDDDYLVIASDGLWDILRNKDVSDICYAQGAQGAQHLADELVQTAIARGSMDNVTCVVVRLTAHVNKLIQGGGEAMPAPQQGRESPTTLLGVIGGMLGDAATAAGAQHHWGGYPPVSSDSTQATSKLNTLRAFTLNSMRGSPLQTDQLLLDDELAGIGAGGGAGGGDKATLGKPSSSLFGSLGGSRSAIPRPLSQLSSSGFSAKDPGSAGPALGVPLFRSIAGASMASAGQQQQQQQNNRLLSLQSPIQAISLVKRP